ncbi:MAG: DUF499 domain-containing protein [Planctomycetaceae bacterium]|nr:MAG: DUF499 domain-containing protein [Planctomycetaceae bacterium]
MLELHLREEFRGQRLKGTTVDFKNQSGTGALDVSAAEFLKITYPSHDLLKTIEATQQGQSRPVVLLGSRGQGKSHLMAALYHLCHNPAAATAWLTEWSSQLKNPQIGELKLRNDCFVIAESLHLQRYKYLWDVLFALHPRGQWYEAKWSGMADKKTDVPSYDLMMEMFTDQPTVLILDEFQTWYEGLTNTKQYPWRNWAFNFIQILSEIAQKNPEKLVLIVSVREGNSDAYQQIRRVNPVDVDFKGPYAKRDRQRLLLYRIFENRMQVPDSDIAKALQPHVSEYFRLSKTPPQEQQKRTEDFIESFPFAPHLLKLLDDQVLIATDAQETRDLIKILVDLFKTHDRNAPIITAADFSLTNQKSGVSSLLDSVANQLHKDLREKALRNYTAVIDAVPEHKSTIPHAEEIISALWLRSLTVDQMAGAEPYELQIDITGASPIDDNRFEVELANIVDNSFNIHQIGSRLVFKREENARSKLLAHAKNNKLFQNGEDIDQLAKEVRAVIGGAEDVSAKHRVIVLKKKWQSDPWSESDEKEQPKNWNDGRLPLIVVPDYPEKLDTSLGKWLKDNLQENRNTIRFLLPQKGSGNVHFDRELLVLARAVWLASKWKATEKVYAELERAFRKDELIPKLKRRFERFAILSEWNYADPAKCRFEEAKHDAQGDKIPDAVDRIVREEVFIPEEFEEYVLRFAENSHSIGKLLKDLREPRPGGNPCIPWLGEIAVKERVIRMCAEGQIAIDLRGTEMLQTKPGEETEFAWTRMKGKLGTGKHLDQTILLLPDAESVSGGKSTATTNGLGPQVGAASSGTNDTGAIFGAANVQVPPNVAESKPESNLFGDTTGSPPPTLKPCSAPATSSLNLLGQVESWGIGPATSVNNVALKVGKMTGAQLQALIKHLPDGVTYGLELEKEEKTVKEAGN